jgi:hypothetical protein
MWDLNDALILANLHDEAAELVTQRRALWPDDAEQQDGAAWEYAKLSRAASDDPGDQETTWRAPHPRPRLFAISASFCSRKTFCSRTVASGAVRGRADTSH